jgi:hypothetical protein
VKALGASSVLSLLLLCACTSGSGTKWYAPLTWFSGAPAQAVDTAKRQEATAEHAALEATQAAVYRFNFALEQYKAGNLLALAVAMDAGAQAQQLLDQVLGAPKVGEVAKWRDLVARLISDNADVRAAAQRENAKQSAAVEKLSAALDRAQEKTAAIETKLRVAYDRENALANELRAQRALLWSAGGVAVLCAAGWVYVRFFLGGLPSAFAKGLADLRAKGVIPPPHEPNVFDSYLNRHEQAIIARHAT